MPIQSDMSFYYKGGALDDKQNFKTKAEMKNFPEEDLGKTAMATCNDDGGLYIYNINNVSNEKTGKWRKQEASTEDTSLDDVDWVSSGLGFSSDKTVISTLNIRLKRKGNTVAFNISGYAEMESSTTTRSSVITNLPSKYCPNSTRYFNVLGYGVGDNVGVYNDSISINNIGTIDLLLQGTPKGQYFNWRGEYNVKL